MKEIKTRYLVKYVYDCGVWEGVQRTDEMLWWMDKPLYMINELIRDDLNNSTSIIKVDVYELKEDSYVIRPVNTFEVKKEELPVIKKINKMIEELDDKK